MKIVAVIDEPLTSGGGINQAANAVRMLAEAAPGRFEFAVLSTFRDNLPLLAAQGIDAVFQAPTLRDRLLAMLAGSMPWQSLQRVLRVRAPAERRLAAMGARLAYFATPSTLALALQDTPFAITVFDLCHRDFPEFPEVRAFGEFSRREHLLRNALPQAVAVVADSPETATRLTELYGVAAGRLVALPFSPAFGTAGDESADREVLARHRLDAPYFFYPAQYWRHKNHLGLLAAMRIARKTCPQLPRLVLSGADKGAWPAIAARIRDCGLEGEVRALGFIPHRELGALYRNAAAAVVPTYFGPTNLPPLEAWQNDCPLIYPARFVAQAGDAALAIDPDDPDSLAAALVEVLAPETRARLIAAGQRRLAAIAEEREAARERLLAMLETFRRRIDG